MTKIVFAISEMGVGGAEKVFYDMAVGLNQYKDNYQVSVVCLYERGRIGKRLAEKGVEVHDRILKNRFDVKGMLKFINILRNKRPDVLYIAGQTLTQAISFVASIFIKMPVRIIAVHSHDLAQRALYKMFIDRVTFNSATHIVCVSESQKQHIVMCKRIPPEKIKVIYNGVDVDRFKRKKRIENGFSIPEGAVVIGVLASLREEKRLDILIQAIPDVLRHWPEACFVIVGDGIERHKLEYMAKALGVYSNVRFLGERDDIANVASIFDIGCLCSRTENFPLSVLEYMACGKPVVVTRVGGIPEMVKDGMNGFLVKPESPSDLSKKILSLINDKPLRRSMGIEGRKIVKDSFTLDKMIDNYMEFFEEAKI